jgi:hypothetical protein
MFLCVGKPDYQWEKKIAALEPHQFAAWKKGAASLRDKLDADGVNQANFKEKLGYVHDLMMDSDEVAAWTEAGVDITMSRVKGLASPGRGRDIPQAVYQIAVANVGLLQIQMVDYLEDCCTNELQGYLDKGWRILAVCPPNNTRRPTYIIGHFERDKRR